MNLMTQQQQQTERLLQEQQRLSEVLDRLHATLSQPLRLGQPVIHVHPAQVTMNAPAPITPVPVKPAENLPQLGSKQMVGAIEDVYFPDLDLTVTSRIDTGAGLSSIDATEMEEFERDGKKWVRFKMTFTDDKEALELEQRLLRHVRVRQSITDDYERRPVIELQTVIGTVSQKTEFTLTDRSHLDYSVLIGRNGLRDVMVVDVSRKKLTKPKTSKP